MHPEDMILFHLSSVLLRGYKVAQLKSSNLKNESCSVCAFIHMCIYICIMVHLDLGNHIYCGHFLALAVDAGIFAESCYHNTNFKPHESF